MTGKTAWYVLQVSAGREKDVQKELEKRGYKALAPMETRLIRNKQKWSQKEYILFNGYVFVRMNYLWAKYYAIAGIRGVIKILGGGQNPTELARDEINTIIGLDKYLKEPSIIKFDESGYEIISGVLLDLKDNIKEVKRRNKYATVSMKIAGEEQIIELSFDEPKNNEPKNAEADQELSNPADEQKPL